MAKASAVLEMARQVFEGGITQPEAIAQVAQQYYEAVSDLRSRVQQAVELARSGLRMEVRTIAEANPPLLDAADLFRPQRTESVGADGRPLLERNTAYLWREYCKAHSLPVPPKISEADLLEIQTALLALGSDVVEQLHRHYRKQNLANASLFARLRTLRNIAAHDLTTSVWRDDIAPFETAALRELQADFTAAIKGGSLEEAAEIVEKLSAPDWESPAAAVASTDCSKQLAKALGIQAREQAGALKDQVYASYMAQAADALEGDLDQWDALVQTMSAGGVRPPSDAAATVDAARNWLAEHRSAQELRARIAACTEELKRAVVDSKGGVEEIQRCLMAVEALPGGVPDDLRMLAERRTQELLASARLRRTLTIAGGIAAVIVILGGSVWAILYFQEMRRQEKFSTDLTAAVAQIEAEGDVSHTVAQQMLGEAKKVEGPNAGYDSLPAAVAATEELERLARGWAEQDAQFERLLAAAGDSKAPGAELVAIERAESAARTGEHRERVTRWKSEFRVAADLREKERDGKLGQKLTALQEQVDKVDEGFRGSALDPAVAQGVTSAEQTVTKLQGEIAKDGASNSNQARLQGLIARIGDLRAEVERAGAAETTRRGEAAAMEEILAATADAILLSGKLREFEEQFPASPYAADFTKAAEQSGYWSGVLDWQRAVVKDAAGDVIPRTQRGRDARGKALARFASSNPGSPYTTGIADYQQLLSGGDEWSRELESLITEWWPMKVDMVELVDGTRWYTEHGSKGERPVSGKVAFKVYLKPDSDQASPMTEDRSKIKRAAGPSPQALLCEQLEPLVEDPERKGSAEGALEALQLVRDFPDLDPFLRAQLIYKLLPLVQSALPLMKNELQKWIDDYQARDSAINNTNWIAPGDSSKRPDYARVQKLIAGLPVAHWKSQREDEIRRVGAWLNMDLRPVGILDQISAPKQVRWSEAAKVQPGEQLYAVQVDEQGAGQLVAIGKTGKAGEVQLNLAIATMPSGTPVFAGRFTSLAPLSDLSAGQ